MTEKRKVNPRFPTLIRGGRRRYFKMAKHVKSQIIFACSCSKPHPLPRGLFSGTIRTGVVLIGEGGLKREGHIYLSVKLYDNLVYVNNLV
jgi:hypothetical protein